jgi:hypothetical protein
MQWTTTAERGSKGGETKEASASHFPWREGEIKVRVWGWGRERQRENKNKNNWLSAATKWKEKGKKTERHISSPLYEKEN